MRISGRPRRPDSSSGEVGTHLRVAGVLGLWWCVNLRLKCGCWGCGIATPLSLSLAPVVHVFHFIVRILLQVLGDFGVVLPGGIGTSLPRGRGKERSRELVVSNWIRTDIRENTNTPKD